MSWQDPEVSSERLKHGRESAEGRSEVFPSVEKRANEGLVGDEHHQFD